MKDERELLTRQRISERLAWEAKHSVLGNAIACGALTLFLVIHCCLLIPKTYAALAWLAVLPGVIGFIPPSVRSLSQLGKVRRGEFAIVEDSLIDVRTDQLNKKRAFFFGDFSIWNKLLLGRGYSYDCYEHVFQFKSGRRFVANAQTYRGTRLETVADFSMAGDIFFLVIYQDDPQKIVLLYSSKIYRYQERENTTLW